MISTISFSFLLSITLIFWDSTGSREQSFPSYGSLLIAICICCDVAEMHDAVHWGVSPSLLHVSPFWTSLTWTILMYFWVVCHDTGMNDDDDVRCEKLLLRALVWKDVWARICAIGKTWLGPPHCLCASISGGVVVYKQNVGTKKYPVVNFLGHKITF